MPLELRKYSAYVRCGEQDLELYGIKEEDDKTVSCWIASEAGKNFSVGWYDRPNRTTMSVALEVDGHQVCKAAHEQQSSGSFRGARDGRKHMRPFQFAPLILTDDDTAGAPGATHCAELGTIRLTMTRVRRYVKEDRSYTGHDAYDLQPVHERSKKAGIHAVSFGAAESVPACGSVLSIGKEKEPFANFIFRYRPLEILRANGIAPLLPVKRAHTSSARTDSDGRAGGQSSKRSRKRGREDPSPADDSGTADIKGEPDEEDEEDLAELQQQLATIQRRIEAKAANRAKRKVKREVSPIRVPSSSSREPEVIDLT